jgi:hypothetical protein
MGGTIDPSDALADAETIRGIADRAHDLLLEYLQLEYEEQDDSPVRERLATAIAALHFCGHAAIELGDPALFDAVADPLALIVEIDVEDWMYGDTATTALAEATAKLLARRGRLDERVVELAGDSSPVVRAAIAQGLAPAVPGAAALLRKLAADGDADVRKAARASLGGANDVPWWSGALPADPVTRVGAKAAARHRPKLEEAVAALAATEWGHKEAIAKVRAAVADLPGALAADVAERALVVLDVKEREDLADLAARVVESADLSAALERLVVFWGAQPGVTSHVVAAVGEALAKLPKKRLAPVVRALTARALGPVAQRHEYLSVEKAAAELVAKAWAPSLDVAPVIDAIDALSSEDAERDPDEPHDADVAGDLDWAVHTLMDLLQRVAPDAKLAARLADRFVDPPSSAWRGARHPIGAYLARLDAAALRPIAERAASARDEEVVRWGLEALATGARRGSDPPVADLVASWVEDPRLRPAVAQSHALRPVGLPALRAKLLTGELDFFGAAETMLQAGREHGGIFGSDTPPTHLALRAEEWDAYRAIRDAAALPDSYLWSRALTTFPPGPRHPADRALFTRAIAASREDPDIVHWVETMIGRCVDEHSLAQIDELLSFAPESRRAGLLEQRKVVAKTLGIVSPPVAAPGAPSAAAPPPFAAPAAPAREWMDEPDDD